MSFLLLVLVPLFDLKSQKRGFLRSLKMTFQRGPPVDPQFTCSRVKKSVFTFTRYLYCIELNLDFYGLISKLFDLFLYQ